MENVRIEKIASVKFFETSSLFSTCKRRANHCDLRIRLYENFFSRVPPLPPAWHGSAYDGDSVPALAWI